MLGSSSVVENREGDRAEGLLVDDRFPGDALAPGQVHSVAQVGGKLLREVARREAEGGGVGCKVQVPDLRGVLSGYLVHAVPSSRLMNPSRRHVPVSYTSITPVSGVSSEGLVAW